MISISDDNRFSAAGPCSDYRGLSTDEKPLNAHNMDTFLEADTGDLYYFEGVAQVWVKFGEAPAEIEEE